MRKKITVLLFLFLVVASVNYGSHQVYSQGLSIEPMEMDKILDLDLPSIEPQSTPGLTLETFDHWYNEYLKDQKVGYRHEKRQTETLNGQNVISNLYESQLTLKRAESTIVLKDFVKMFETPDGKPLKFEYESTGGQKHVSKIKGLFDGNTLNITSESYGNITNSTVETDGTVVFPYSIDKLFAQNPMSSFRYKTILPSFGASVINVSVEYVETAEKNILGEMKTLHKYKINLENLPNVKIHEWRDDNGILYISSSSLFNSRTVFSTEREATREDNISNMDIMANSLIVTERMIPDPKNITHAKYKIGLTNATPEKIFVFDNRQSYEVLPTGDIVLEVKSYIPDFLTSRIPLKGEGLDHYLQSNNFIQPDNALIAAKAKEIIGKEKNAYKAAKKLEKWVHQFITDKSYDVGFASAGEVIENAQGDCTEHAVLLASLCRSVGLPARVVVGIVYTSVPETDTGAFAYHMWNEVYVGEWISLDATIAGLNVVDSTHIALKTSSLNNPSDLSALSEAALNAIGNINMEILNFASRASGFYDIERLSIKNPLEFDLSKLVIRNAQKGHHPINYINVSKFIDEDPIEKFNISGKSTRSPLLETYEGAFTEGMSIYASGDVNKALVFFRKSANLIPKGDAKKYYDLGVRLSGVMAFNLAKDLFEKAIATEDKIWSKKAQEYLNNNFPKEGYSERAEKFNIVGYSFANFADNIKAASLMYRKALIETPEFDSALYNYSLLNIFEGDYEKALKNLNKTVSVNPDFYKAYLTLGNVHQDLGNISQAINNYEKAILHGKQDVNFVKDAQYNLALIKVRRQLDQNPEDIKAYIILGKTLLSNEDFKRARKAFVKALSINENNVAAHAGLGNTFLRNGSIFDAEKEFNRALEINPHNIESLVGLGIIYHKRLELTKAIQVLQKALSIEPKNKLALKTLGEAYFEEGKSQKAINTYGKLNTATGLYNIGKIYAYEGNDSRAKDYYLRALEKDPFDARIYKELGRIYLDEVDYGKARDSLRTAMSLDSNYAEAYFLMAKLEESVSNIKEAINNYVTAFMIDQTKAKAYNRAYRLLEERGELESFKLPSPKYKPTKKEESYLTKILHLQTQFIDIENDVINNLLTKAKYGNVWVITDKPNQARLRQIYRRYLGQLRALYKEVYAISPPENFEALHTVFLKQLWENANAVHTILGRMHLDFFSKDEKTQSVISEVQGKTISAGQKALEFEQLITKIFDAWDVISVNEIIINSGYTEKMMKEALALRNKLQAKQREVTEKLKGKGFNQLNFNEKAGL